MKDVNINYRRKYINTYIWQILSTLLGFVSLFIVTPYISSDKTLYGVFSICISLTIYFSYADLGVLSAVSKYAAECYVKEDLNSEMKLIGFSSFIMFLTFSLMSVGILLLSIWPTIIIPDLIPGSNSFYVARYLLLTLALSSPLLIFQRVISCIFNIRVEIFKFQRIVFVGNVLRILSALYFFYGDRYEIVEYYVCYQIINVFIILLCLISVRKYGYSVKKFISYFRFDSIIFKKIKRLCGISIFGMVTGMLMVDLDNILVSRFCGIEAVAVYAIALYLYSLVRTYKSIVYGTFTSRFNHFVGLSDYSGLNRFTTKITVMTAPIIIVPVLILAIMCEPFIISWVGLSYRESGLVTSFLVLFFLTNFISMPAEDYFNAKVQIRTIFYYRLIPLVIYFVGILVVTKYIGVLSFGVCKSFAAFVSSVYVVWVMSRDYRKTNDTYISLKHVLSIVVTVITTGIVCFCLKNIMSCEKSKMDLLHNIVVMVTCYIMCLVIAIPFNQYLRCETKSMISCVKKYCSGFLHVK